MAPPAGSTETRTNADGAAVDTGQAPRLPSMIPRASIDQGAEMPHAFMSIQKAFVTYSEGMTRDAATAQPWDPGACRRR
jgi:hypothetical protein